MWQKGLEVSVTAVDNVALVAIDADAGGHCIGLIAANQQRGRAGTEKIALGFPQMQMQSSRLPAGRTVAVQQWRQPEDGARHGSRRFVGLCVCAGPNGRYRIVAGRLILSLCW